jgi:REP element-mobilizing transposase RayT
VPHFDSPDVVQTITFRLADSLPTAIYREWAQLPAADKRRYRLDRVLDEGLGACILREPKIAAIVEDALLHFDGERYGLLAWVVMPNHVHLLILPEVPIPVLMRWLKGSTARSANRILGRTGQPFWQDESWDHYLRGSSQVERTTSYIEENPVSAGLVRSAERWQWSSAGWQAEPPAPPNPPVHRARM